MLNTVATSSEIWISIWLHIYSFLSNSVMNVINEVVCHFMIMNEQVFYNCFYRFKTRTEFILWNIMKNVFPIFILYFIVIFVHVYASTIT